MTSAWSAPEVFLVSTEDGAPSDPSWVSPVDGEEIVELDPVLTWTASVDPEGTAVSYAVEGDVVASFDSAALVSVAVAATGAGTDSVDLSGAGIELPENVPVFLRVRGTDAAGLSSAWAVVEVFSRGDNDAPGVPELISPEEGTQVEEGTPELVCAVVNDAEADEVRYEIMVSTTPDTAGRVTGADDLVAGADVRWQVEIDLGDGIYYWSARASDDRGGTSAWAELRSFVVGDGTPGTGDSGGGDTGPVDDTTGGDQVGEEEPAEDVGCGCAGAGRVAIAWLGVGLAAAGARRRRV
jgi:hypothetical protein